MTQNTGPEPAVSRDQADFMYGREIENTPAKGMQTLFLAKLLPVTTIGKILPPYCPHIYFGANKSFPTTKMTLQEWNRWESTIRFFLEQGFLCTLDIPLSQWNDLLETSLVEQNNFILMLSVEMPYVNQAGYNACLKIDDTSIDGANGGVWVHKIHDLRTRDTWTPWHEYKGDKMFKLNP